MKTCKNDNNPYLAKGLCRACFDALPEQIARRAKLMKSPEAVRKLKLNTAKKALKKWYTADFKDTPQYREYLKNYIHSPEYKAWKASQRAVYLKLRERITRYSKPGAVTRGKKRTTEEQRAIMREYYHRKKRGEVYDNKTKSWRVPTSNDTKVFKTVSTNNKRTQSPPISP